MPPNTREIKSYLFPTGQRPGTPDEIGAFPMMLPQMLPPGSGAGPVDVPQVPAGPR